MKIHDVGDPGIVNRHVGPVGMPGDRYKIKLPFRAQECVIQASMTVGETTIIVDVTVEGPKAEAARERRETGRKPLLKHRLVSWDVLRSYPS